jgi:hypothetical protein
MFGAWLAMRINSKIGADWQGIFRPAGLLEICRGQALVADPFKCKAFDLIEKFRCGTGP